jgi:hypothetical protein
MKTIETKVYEYDELSKEAQEKAREWYSQGNDYPFLSGDMHETLETLLKDCKWKCEDPKVYYSLSYSQGDGAMFEGTVHFTYKKRKYIANVRQSGHYYHYNSKAFDIVTDNDDQEEIYSEDVRAYFNNNYVNMCEKLAKAGYKYIEWEDAEENIAENIRANEYTFTEDGKRFG